MYHVITSKKNKKVLATKNFTEMFEFISKYSDSKVRTLDHNAKLKILNRNHFLKSFYSKFKNKSKFYQLAEIMIENKNNFSDFIGIMDLRIENKNYKLFKNKI